MTLRIIFIGIIIGKLKWKLEDSFANSVLGLMYCFSSTWNLLILAAYPARFWSFASFSPRKVQTTCRSKCIQFSTIWSSRKWNLLVRHIKLLLEPFPLLTCQWHLKAYLSSQVGMRKLRMMNDEEASKSLFFLVPVHNWIVALLFHITLNS